MVIFGDGPSRAALQNPPLAQTAAPEAEAPRVVRADPQVALAQASGIRVLPAPITAPEAPVTESAVTESTVTEVAASAAPSDALSGDTLFTPLVDATAPDPAFIDIATAEPAADSVFAPEAVAEDSAALPGRIGTRNANIRAEPNKGGGLVGTLAAGSAVQVLWVEPNGWVRVISQDGTISGFAHKSLFAELPAADPAADLGTPDAGLRQASVD